MLHGVAHIRVSTSPCAVTNDFYAVFVRGVMLPNRFPSWKGADHLFRLLTTEPATEAV